MHSIDKIQLIVERIVANIFEIINLNLEVEFIAPGIFFIVFVSGAAVRHVNIFT